MPQRRVIVLALRRQIQPTILTDPRPSPCLLYTSYMRELNFDTAAVLNPAVHAMALEVMDPKRILYGTDLLVFLWHGKRRWTQWEYFNLAREDFPWNRHEEGPEAEAGYTFFLYEQLRSILDLSLIHI